MDVAATLRAYRKRSARYGTQAKLRTKVGLSKTGLYYIESGRRVPNRKTLEKMIEALGIPAGIAADLRDAAANLRALKAGSDKDEALRAMWEDFREFLLDDGLDDHANMDDLEKGFREAVGRHFRG